MKKRQSKNLNDGKMNGQQFHFENGKRFTEGYAFFVVVFEMMINKKTENIDHRHTKYSMWL